MMVSKEIDCLEAKAKRDVTQTVVGLREAGLSTCSGSSAG